MGFWPVLGATFGGVILALGVAAALRAAWRWLDEHAQLKTIEDLRRLHLAVCQQAKAGTAFGIVHIHTTRAAIDGYVQEIKDRQLTPRVRRAIAESASDAEEDRLIGVCAKIMVAHCSHVTSRGEQFLRECTAAIESAIAAETQRDAEQRDAIARAVPWLAKWAYRTAPNAMDPRDGPGPHQSA